MIPVNEVRIDSLKLVQERQVGEGTLPVAGFARLAESLHEASGVLAYRVRGTRDSRERPLLRLHVTGSVQLQCQRCLEAFEYGVDVDSALRLVPAALLDSEYDDDPNEPDCVPASVTFDLAALIEDEVLLALPPYPRHEEGHCTARGAATVAAAETSGAKVLAFNALQALKQKGIPSKEQ